MLKSELIKKLNEVSDEDYQVCLLNFNKHLNNSDLGATAEGIYPDYEIELQNDDSDDISSKKFISLTFQDEK